MNYLLAENLSKSFGDKVLFENITFGLERGQKAGLIARNGTGKSTLLDIIARRAIPDTGQVVIRKGVRMLYLSQDPELDPDQKVIDTVLGADTEQASLIKEYEQLVAIPSGKWTPGQRDMFDRLSARISELDAWQFESRVKEVLGKLDIHDFDQRCGILSGGQKKKVALARVLVEEADLLILDEPTNHLDIDTIEWMEEFLERTQLTLLLVTHDRYFLDQVCDFIIEIERGNIYQYRGDYRYYLEKKSEREQVESVTAAKQKALFLKELQWIRRMPKARTHKSKARVENFDRIEDRVRSSGKTVKQEFFVKMDRLGNKILEINNLSKSFDNLKIIEDFSYTFKKGEKIGLVGKNGIGKSTFLELVLGIIKPEKGRVVTGQTVKMACFTQQGITMDDNRRVIDIVRDVAEEVYIDDKHTISASRFLSMFGIAHDIQYNYVQYLSGGERRKLHLLMTLMEQPNFLMLDEPTNDLDIQTLQSLEAFLEQYKGCLLVASHDRFFLDKIADHLFIFEGGGAIKDHYGNYTDYRRKRDLIKRKTQPRKVSIEDPSIKTRSVDRSKPTWKELREYETLTEEIDRLEGRKRELEEMLQTTNADHIQLQRWSEEIGEIIDKIDEMSERWLLLSEKISG